MSLRKYLSLLLFLAIPLLGLPQLSLAREGQIGVTELKHWSTPDYTRVAITLEKEAKFEYHKLPNRLYIDISGGHLRPGIKDFPVGDGLLKSVRVAQFSAATVRVVLDLDSIKDYKVFTFSDPFRIIVDVKGQRREEISAVKEVIETAKPEPKAAEPSKPKPEVVKEKPATTFKPGRIRRIVVDPGHGGHDPGAMSVSGTREKDVVLAIGLKLAQKIREELGIEVVMTRSTDVFLELQERTALANKVGADLFVSIHANASLNRGASGVETYYLNLAKTEKVAQLAAKENGTSIEKVSVLQAVLFDLMANYKLNDSAHLADFVQKAVYKRAKAEYPGLKNLGVKQGPFYVLVGATMPSILVETAFVTNEKDEQKLKDGTYQEATAEGVMQGIKAYISSLK
ncbi:N-acetylmuramoyl-L-alanine amidase [Geomesophilobacter sediminis]|uniref:N-acetylmuramoyl-L-alanine amidase n=1 Tax=Geomesophilobacter sediminis TaxID=2798584 RepID=A0A8J7IQK6_9BACT|nr:N-acetylmuramoyl-L-alanine amidase [Geomesophilobacter sediminis]MBJ6726198.1 N-acetylmuramoyl-L-alanine amidase [Geomesophilobacter sediminis]